MSESRESKGGGGIDIAGVVGVVFIVLKLLDVEPVASWGWLWVLSPFWIGIAIVLGFLLIMAWFSVASEGAKSVQAWFGKRRMRRMIAKVKRMEDEEAEHDG